MGCPLLVIVRFGAGEAPLDDLECEIAAARFERGADEMEVRCPESAGAVAVLEGVAEFAVSVDHVGTGDCDSGQRGVGGRRVRCEGGLGAFCGRGEIASVQIPQFLIRVRAPD
jgi:hypothetical protein